MIYLYLSIKVGQLSEKKGLSYFFGFIVSFCISPIIGFVIVSMRKEQVLIKDSKNCPYCYNKIHKRSFKCIHCNETLIKDVDVESYQKRIDEEIKNREEEDYRNKWLGYIIILKWLGIFLILGIIIVLVIFS